MPTLDLNNYPDFIHAIRRTLIAFGDAGILLAAYLNDEKIQRPHEISLNQFLVDRYSTILVENNVKFPSLALATQHADKRRQSGLHRPLPFADFDADDAEEDTITSVTTPPPSLISQITDSTVAIKLMLYFDEYKNALRDKLVTIFSTTISSWLADPMLTALEAEPHFQDILAGQDVFELYDLLKDICLRLGGDQVDDLINVVRDLKQSGPSTPIPLKIAAIKGKLDGCFRSLEAYGSGQTDIQKCRAILRVLTDPIFRNDMIHFHALGKNLPPYEELCRTLQATEDAHAAINRQLGIFSPTPFGSLLLAGATGGAVAHCSICFKRTLSLYGVGRQYPHLERLCKHKDWESSK